MNWNRLFDNKWFYRLLALVFAVLLFNYVNSIGIGDREQSSAANNQNGNSVVAERSETLNFPLSINVDSDKYFVSGYPEKVKIKISGQSSLVTAATNTRNFSVYADLTGLKPGQHWVKLKQAGLNRDLNYQISPAKIKVKISLRKTRTFPVSVNYSSDQLASGYQADKAVVSPRTVTVTGAKKDVERIAKVQANLQLPSGTQSTVNRQVMLQAVNNSGKILNVVISPETVKVRLPIFSSESEKKVPLNFVASGNSDNYDYSFSSNTKEVTVKGTKSALANLSKFTVSVPIDNVTSDTTKEVDLVLPSKGISSVNPKSVRVNINVSSVSAGNANSAGGTTSAKKDSSTSSTESESSDSDSGTSKTNASATINSDSETTSSSATGSTTEN
ncbi:YbbR-like domain-containing protein [Liquorilactobacillus vini]|uniref:CdaR family protein n=1 Tax=Liquorilactobacillus vini TaxID=238015 RepID=UPI00031AC619|nr:CdaR family protein [Liquorilactobacillus vini]